MNTEKRKEECKCKTTKQGVIVNGCPIHDNFSFPQNKTEVKCCCGEQELIGNASVEVGGVCHRKLPCYYLAYPKESLIENRIKDIKEEIAYVRKKTIQEVIDMTDGMTTPISPNMTSKQAINYNTIYQKALQDLSNKLKSL